MEPPSVFGTAKAVAQLASVIKGHFSSHAELYSWASSIEAKASRAKKVASRLGIFAECPDVWALLFSYTVQDLEKVHARMTKIDSQISQGPDALLFFGAPYLIRQLDDVNTKLSQLDVIFRVVGMSGRLSPSQREKARMSVLSIASACLSVLNSPEQRNRVYEEMELILQIFTSGALFVQSREQEAEFAFAMGRRDFEICFGGAVRSDIDPDNLKRAARYFRKACQLGKKEAFRYLGDIIYDGYDGTGCFRTAVKIYEDGVSRNDAPSQFRLAMCYEFGHGLEQSEPKAIELYNGAVEKGCGESMYTVGHQALHGVMVPSNHRRAFRLIKKAVEMNVEAAKGELAICYKKGIGCEQDLEKAAELFREAFDAGSFWDIIDLAECYDNGEGVSKDPSKATKLYESCINAGTWHGNLFKAMYGLRVVRGLGIKKDESRGISLILEASKEEAAYPWFALGECYRYGYGVKMNKSVAKRYYKKAVKQLIGVEGVIKSYEALGQMYETGEGVLADCFRASKYYLFAADKLSQVGQWKSAKAFEQGIGQRKDIHRAVYYFKLCANSGHEHAQRRMMVYYLQGHGIERSRTYARKLMTEAAKAENRDAKHCLFREDFRDVSTHIQHWSL